jgi:hypothetical protein
LLCLKSRRVQGKVRVALEDVPELSIESGRLG